MHINVGCSDFDRSYDFYTQLVGMLPLTAEVLRTQKTDLDVDLKHVRDDGGRVGEWRTTGEYAELGATVLGLEGGETAENRGVLLYWDDQPLGPYIDLQQWDKSTGPERVSRAAKDLGIGRIAMFVDDLDPKVQRLKDADVRLVSEPVTTVVGVTQMRVMCFYDPDGTMLEFVELTKGWNA